MPIFTADQKALVLFSGGQDSTVALAWALERYGTVETVGFDYGQRHVVELGVRQTVCDKMCALKPEWNARLGQDHMVDLNVLSQVSASALTHDIPIEPMPNGLPSTFVPGRNLIFFTFAATVAYARGAKHLVGGMCETDYSGYPDCRDDTLKALQVALNLGMDKRFVLHTPLMWIDKAETWALAHELGGDVFVQLIIEDTHTCYAGDREHRHDWGYGCDACPACELRARGFERWRSDTT